jgi:hypothetical protein
MKKILFLIITISAVLSGNEYLKAQKNCDKILVKAKVSKEASNDIKYTFDARGRLLQHAQYRMLEYNACLTKILVDFR